MRLAAGFQYSSHKEPSLSAKEKHTDYHNEVPSAPDKPLLVSASPAKRPPVRLLWAWPQGYGQTPVPSQRPLVIVPWHVGRGPAGSAEELRMEAAEEALMGPTIPDPSLLPGGPLVSFLVWAEAITWIPTWEGTLNVGPQPLSSLKSLHSHGDALHLFPRDRLDPETLDPGPPLE
ncbi:uncharacterized protein LOC116456180 isoform X2 [Hylobates moloch]|uniref:uncharacterized protein LOC116456180 isoform X2 n=1 Tax=Hylobates moloch TaxID=81572 RepID=UPI0013644E5F|nr:uncharacterized protein LOC116456180 isoform X2 [Hylobates moloch]